MPAFNIGTGNLAEGAFGSFREGFSDGERLQGERQRRRAIAERLAIQRAEEARRAKMHPLQLEQAELNHAATRANTGAVEQRTAFNARLQPGVEHLQGQTIAANDQAFEHGTAAEAHREALRPHQVDSAAESVRGQRASNRNQESAARVAEGTEGGKVNATNAKNALLTRQQLLELDIADSRHTLEKGRLINESYADLLSRENLEALMVTAPQQAAELVTEARRKTVEVGMSMFYEDPDSSLDFFLDSPLVSIDKDDVPGAKWTRLEDGRLGILDGDGEPVINKRTGKPFGIEEERFLEEYKASLPISSEQRAQAAKLAGIGAEAAARESARQSAREAQAKEWDAKSIDSAKALIEQAYRGRRNDWKMANQKTGLFGGKSDPDDEDIPQVTGAEKEAVLAAIMDEPFGGNMARRISEAINAAGGPYSQASATPAPAPSAAPVAAPVDELATVLARYPDLPYAPEQIAQAIATMRERGDTRSVEQMVEALAGGAPR